MKIDDSKKKPVHGDPLSSFVLGDCVRLVDNAGSAMFLGHVYIVGTSFGVRRLAINLGDGSHRTVGQFALEPNAEVVL